MFVVLNKLTVYFQSPSVKTFIANNGLLGLFVFALIYSITIIIAPIPGFPFEIMAIGLFGVFQTVLLTYFLSLITSSADFYISKHLGRGFVKRLVGERGLARIDSYSVKTGPELLIVARLFEGHLFKWISYAAGFTKLPFKKFISITSWASIPYHLIILYFGLRIHDLGQLFVTLSIVNYFLVTIPLFYFLLKRLLIRRIRKGF